MMSDLTCTICLDPFKDPVSLPCGHIHCEKCLLAYINAGSKTRRSSCPTCRASFNTTSPDFKHLPRQFRDFVLPSIRRVYIDTTSQADLKKQIARLEARCQSLKNENERISQKSKDEVAAITKRLESEIAAKFEARIKVNKGGAGATMREAGATKIESDAARRNVEETTRQTAAAKREMEELKRKHEMMKNKPEKLRKAERAPPSVPRVHVSQAGARNISGSGLPNVSALFSRFPDPDPFDPDPIYFGMNGGQSPRSRSLFPTDVFALLDAFRDSPHDFHL